MLSNIKNFVKDNKSDIILLIVIVLISLISFSLGYIIAKSEGKSSIIIEEKI
jgi:hypothetical protein